MFGRKSSDFTTHTPSIAFRHLPPRKDIVNQCLEFAHDTGVRRKEKKKKKKKHVKTKQQPLSNKYSIHVVYL